jgi:hypothetical protein
MIDENMFWGLIDVWEMDTKFCSSSTKILSHPSVTALIGMGYEIIPLTLVAMKRNFHLAYVLHKITGAWPVKDEHRGNGPKIIESWYNWAKKQGYQIEAKQKA